MLNADELQFIKMTGSMEYTSNGFNNYAKICPIPTLGYIVGTTSTLKLSCLIFMLGTWFNWSGSKLFVLCNINAVFSIVWSWWVLLRFVFWLYGLYHFHSIYLLGFLWTCYPLHQGACSILVDTVKIVHVFLFSNENYMNSYV